MKTINRTAITIIPKQPYIDWADSFNDVKVYYKEVVTTILIPDKYGEFNYEIYLKKSIKLYLKKSLNPG
jgi:hypothetical protein